MPLEICLLRKISDIDGVIRLLDFYEMPETFVLILERPPRSKDLFDFINDHGFLDESLSRDFLRQVVDTILGKEKISKRVLNFCLYSPFYTFDNCNLVPIYKIARFHDNFNSWKNSEVIWFKSLLELQFTKINCYEYPWFKLPS